MSLPHLVPLKRNQTLSLFVAVLLALACAGCSLFESADAPRTRDWSETAGEGLRGIPPDATKHRSKAAAAEPGKKAPFWEKYRDKRVGQINEHLSVEEPSGW